jgi:hypothetical protein
LLISDWLEKFMSVAKRCNSFACPDDHEARAEGVLNTLGKSAITAARFAYL